MHIALFGGSFNPPHRGHVAVVQALLASKQFDEIWILPCLNHAFGKILASYEDRLHLSHLAFDFLGPQVQVSKAEEEAKNKEGFTINLLRFLKKKYPEAHFFWAMGSDNQEEISRWKDFDQIKELAQIYPISRAGFEPSPFPEVSSSEIREKIQKRTDLKKLELLIPLGVLNYIQKKKLYQS